MYYLSLAAIFRHENCWLDEWVRYHRGLGVEHFYLYNHDDDTHVSDRILQPYVEAGIIDHFHVSEMTAITCRERRLQQCAAIQDAVQRAAGKSKWLGILDMDEFILPRKMNDIRCALEAYEEHGSLVLSWANFGSAGLIKRPSTQINHFLYRAADSYRMNKFVKSIVRPETIDVKAILANTDRSTPHKFVSVSGGMVDENHRPTPLNFYNAYSGDILRINHYPIRSLQDFWDVKVPRGNFMSRLPRNETYWKEYDRNEVFDDEIARRFGHLVE